MKTEEEKILDEIKRAKNDKRPTAPIVVRKRKVVQPIVLPARPYDEHSDLEDIHFCSECKNCRVVKRFNRTDRFCNLHLQVKQFFDYPEHRVVDYDNSKMCLKINTDGKCGYFAAGGELAVE